MNIEELTIESLIKGYKDKQFSVTEIIKLHLERIKYHDKDLNSFITVTEKEALEEAVKKDKMLSNGNTDHPLFGIPIGVKDLFVTKDIKTTAASNVLKDFTPVYDATTVKRLKEAGAIILGKLNCDAWAHGSSGENSDFGPTKNPWHTDYTPGGSSSGSAASVAASFTLASTGSDTGGSIRLPASFTSTVGLKPTYGLVSRYGIIAMASSLDSIGHITKTVYDNAIILNVTAGTDGMDATVVPNKKTDYLKNIIKDIKGLRIGIPKEYIDKGLDADVKIIFKEAVKVFSRRGAQVEEVSLPHTEYAVACYYIIQPSEVSSNLARYDGIRYGNDRTFFGDEAKRRIMLGTFTLSSGYYDAFYKKAMQVRTLIKKDFEKVFENFDVLVAPVSPTLPWKLGDKVNDPLKMYLSDILTVSANLSGHPALSVPAGFSQDKNLPIGIQIIGPHFSEHIIYNVAYAFEQETLYYKQKPNLI